MSQPPQLLANAWTKDQLVITDSVLSDVPSLHAVFSACNYVEPLDNTFRLVNEDNIRRLVESSIALDEENVRFRLQTIRQQGQADIVGYYHLSHEIPRAGAVNISMLVLHPKYQGQKVGQTLVAGLAEQLRLIGYEAMYLRVYLKNWPALQFWIKAGFTTIVKYNGDKQFSPEGQASLTLEKLLL